MTAPDPFASVVTARDVYDATRETQQEIRGVVQRLDYAEQRAAEREAATRDRLDDHQRRIRALEIWRWSLPVSAIGSVAAAVSAIVAVMQGAGG